MTTRKDKGTVDKWAKRIVHSYIELSDEEEAFVAAKAAKKGLTIEEYVRVRCGFPP
ncbi:MAG: hypothetical protein ACRD16_01525 [Thermoanaerobaculia bacterium]